jgi:hypothetical protein
MVAMKKVIDGGKTALVHAHRVDIDPETQNPIVPTILDVDREHHQIVICICPYIGYQTTTLSNARGRETGVDGGGEMSHLGSHVGSATEVSILLLFKPTECFSIPPPHVFYVADVLDEGGVI